MAGTRKPGLYLSGTTTIKTFVLNLIRECVILKLLSTILKDVHHSNEPHDLGNTSESRVDTEVRNYAVHHYFIYCEGPNSLSPNHRQDPATIERVEGVRRENRPGISRLAGIPSL